MGHFLAVTAIRTEDVSSVSQAISQLMQSFEVKHELLDGSTAAQDETDALIFTPINGWTVVLWPNYFNVHDFPLVKKLSHNHDWLISAVHVYDGDYWEHLAVQASSELHSFCSRPSYWSDEPSELERVAAFSPSPEILSSAIGISTSAISPYLVDVDGLTDDSVKAHNDDEFEIADFWVFTDFWRHLGITYPDPPSNPARVVRLSKWFSKRLPSA